MFNSCFLSFSSSSNSYDEGVNDSEDIELRALKQWSPDEQEEEQEWEIVDVDRQRSQHMLQHFINESSHTFLERARRGVGWYHVAMEWVWFLMKYYHYFSYAYSVYQYRIVIMKVIVPMLMKIKM